MRKSIPLGIKILCFVLIASGLITFLIILLALVLPPEFSYRMIEFGQLKEFDVIIALGSISLGWNMIKLKTWTRYMIIVLLYLFLFSIPIAMIFRGISLVRGIINILIILPLIYYFKQSRIKEVFKYE